MALKATQKIAMVTTTTCDKETENKVIIKLNARYVSLPEKLYKAMNEFKTK